jgi:hypothetical protein
MLRGRMKTSRKKRDRWTWMEVKLPERELSESILHLAAPLLEQLGPQPPPEEARRAIELAINLWNAHVSASQLWGNPKPGPLAALRKTMCGRQAAPGLAATFELLSARWHRELDRDPRLVGEWSCDVGDGGRINLVCQTTLPDGVKVHVPPPAEKRIAIGGKFLDEVCIRQSATSYLSFPIEHHCGAIGSDGVATIHAKMPSVVQLFAEGILKPVGGAPVEVTVGTKRLGLMRLAELRCTDYGGHRDVAVLVFRPDDADLARDSTRVAWAKKGSS